jgi:pimeloyl-ACP methyl ester carboxylesterase
VEEISGIWWSVAGDGPAVVVPWLNVDWTEIDLSTLTDRFRVVIVAPRGFGPSVRPGSYDGPGFVADIGRVVDLLGVECYATFGYSMSGVMAARLALANPRVIAVACGGFPLTADLSRMGQRARRRNADARQDSTMEAELLAAYDPAAAVAFWDDVALLPRAALADLECPMRAWWGDQDAVLSSMVACDALASDLECRRIEYDVVPGLDHDGMLDRLDLVLPTIASWLADMSKRPR